MPIHANVPSCFMAHRGQKARRRDLRRQSGGIYPVGLVLEVSLLADSIDSMGTPHAPKPSNPPGGEVRNHSSMMNIA